MIVGGLTFQRVADLEPTRADDGSLLLLTPRERYVNPRALALNRYGAGPFCRFRIPSKYRLSGVYLVTCDDQVRYIGECINLSARFNNGYGNISPRNCYKGGQETNCRLNNLIYQAAANNDRLTLYFYETRDYKRIEERLRREVRAVWNRI
jgi:hypothetical protein